MGDQHAGGTDDVVSGEMLASRLCALGLEPGTVVLVHSSLSGLGRVEGGAATVIEALLAAVGPQGTVLFPALTGTEKDGPLHPPVINVRTAPTWTGRTPETARSWPGAVRSLHPTHSVTAIGADAARWASGHERVSTPCGDGSPYHRLMEEGGFILLLGGVTHQSNTTLHAIEELEEVPYHLQPEATDGVVIDVAGHKRVVRNRLHQWGWGRDFLKVDAPLAEASAVRKARIGASESTLIDAPALRDVLMPILHRDPLYLLRPDAREQWLAAAGNA